MKIAEPVNNSVLNIIKTIKYDFDEMKKMESELQPSDGKEKQTNVKLKQNLFFTIIITLM